MYMEAIKVINLEGKPDLWLPPGFRFHPTDDELVSFYLTGKILNSSFAAHAIAEVDLNKYEPWDLPEKANIGEKDQWYFFTLRDRKYPTGMRTNRATVAGYWKATGKDRDVISSRTSCLVGMKKTLVFYKGRAPRGEKTNWIMHEYRLEGKIGALSRIETTSPKEWVVCRVFQKKAGAKKHMALQTEKDVSYSDSEPPSPVADEAHLKPTENTDTNNEVDWYNDQVSCITRNQCEDFENREYFAPGNACNRRGNKTSFVGPPADNPSSTRAAIMKNSLYTNTLANESLSITAKIPILAREHTSSQYSVPLSSSAVNTLIKTCKVEPSYSNLTVDHSLPVTTPPITEILSSWMGENMAMDYDNLDIRQLLPLQLLPPIESGIAADHCRMCIDHENPSTSHRFLQYHLDPSSAMIQLEQ